MLNQIGEVSDNIEHIVLYYVSYSRVLLSHHKSM